MILDNPDQLMLDLTLYLRAYTLPLTVLRSAIFFAYYILLAVAPRSNAKGSNGMGQIELIRAAKYYSLAWGKIGER